MVLKFSFLSLFLINSFTLTAAESLPEIFSSIDKHTSSEELSSSLAPFSGEKLTKFIEFSVQENSDFVEALKDHAAVISPLLGSEADEYLWTVFNPENYGDNEYWEMTNAFKLACLLLFDPRRKEGLGDRWRKLQELPVQSPPQPCCNLVLESLMLQEPELEAFLEQALEDVFSVESEHNLWALNFLDRVYRIAENVERRRRRGGAKGIENSEIFTRKMLAGFYKKLLAAEPEIQNAVLSQRKPKRWLEPVGPMSPALRMLLLEKLLPILFAEFDDAPHRNFWMAGRFRTFQKYYSEEASNEFLFLYSSLLPALDNDSSRDLAIQYVESLKEGGLPVSLPADLLLRSLNGSIREAAIARSIVEFRLTDSSFDLLLEEVEQERPEELYPLIFSRNRLSPGAEARILAELEDPDSVWRGQIYYSCKKWGESALGLLPTIIDSFESDDRREEERQSCALYLISLAPDPLSTLDQLDRFGEQALFRHLGEAERFSEDIIVSGLEQFPGSIDTENRIGSLLVYFSKAFSSMSPKLQSRCKKAVIEALDIHVGPAVDHGFILVMRKMVEERPKWGPELKPLIKEVRSAMN